MDLNLSDLVPGETMVVNVHDGSKALVTSVGRGCFLGVYGGEGPEFLGTPKHWMISTPPLIDPAQVWDEIRTTAGEPYLVTSAPRTWLGTSTGRRFRITEYEVVEPD